MTGAAKEHRPARRVMIGAAVALIVLVGAAGAWFATHPAFGWKSFTNGGPGDISKSEFERRAHDYLVEHPEVIAEAIDRLRAQQSERQAAQAQTAVRARAVDVFRDPDSPVGGNANGNATLVEFFDYNCPYCRQMAPLMAQAEAADPQLRIVYKEFPILGPGSVFAAKAALAANNQGKYVAFHQALYQIRGAVDEAKVLDVAGKLGLNVGRLKTDMQAPAIETQLSKNLDLARALGINGTPGFVVADKVFTGATDLKSLQTVIEASRKSPAKGQ